MERRIVPQNILALDLPYSATLLLLYSYGGKVGPSDKHNTSEAMKCTTQQGAHKTYGKGQSVGCKVAPNTGDLLRDKRVYPATETVGIH
jgi:hypothetical protein